MTLGGLGPVLRKYGVRMPDHDFWNYASRVYPSQAERVEYLRPLVRLFSPNRTVVDLACGRGEFLDVLREAGHTAVGVDTSSQSREWVTQTGFPFYQRDVFDFLSEPSIPYDALFSYGFLEHLDPAAFRRLFELMGDRCRAGTEVVLATHDPASLQAHIGPLYNELTHDRLYSSEVVVFALEENGFEVKERGSLHQKAQLVPSSALTPDEDVKFLERLAHCQGVLRQILDEGSHTQLDDLIADLERQIQFIGGRIHVIELVLQRIAEILDHPLDYYVLAVKR